MTAPQLSKLVQRINDAEVNDLHEQAAIRDDLVNLRDVLLKVSSTDLAGCVDAAVTLTRHIGQVTPDAGSEMKQIVCRLVNVIAESVPQLSQAEQVPATRMRKLRPAAPNSNNQDLRLINDMFLGEVLIQLGVLNKEKVDAAIKTQQATNMRFGEALVHLGAASWEDVENGLRLQDHLSQNSSKKNGDRPRAKMADPKEGPPVSAFGSEHLNVLNDMMLGEEMIRMGSITREQLQQALSVQNATGLRIGEALVEVGAATWDQVAEGVRMQALHRDQGGSDRPQRSIAL